MSEEFFNIEFDHDNIHYNGMITPSEKIREDGTPRSFHVVLNNVLFGNVHYNNSNGLLMNSDLIHSLKLSVNKLSNIIIREE